MKKPLTSQRTDTSEIKTLNGDFILQQIASCIFTNFKFIVTNVILSKYQAYAVSKPPFLR